MSICFLSSTTWADIAAFSLINAVQSSWIWKKKNGIVKELFHSDTIMDKQNNYYHGMETG